MSWDEKRRQELAEQRLRVQKENEALAQKGRAEAEKAKGPPGASETGVKKPGLSSTLTGPAGAAKPATAAKPAVAKAGAPSVAPPGPPTTTTKAAPAATPAQAKIANRKMYSSAGLAAVAPASANAATASKTSGASLVGAARKVVAEKPTSGAAAPVVAAATPKPGAPGAAAQGEASAASSGTNGSHAVGGAAQESGAPPNKAAGAPANEADSGNDPTAEAVAARLELAPEPDEDLYPSGENVGFLGFFKLSFRTIVWLVTTVVAFLIKLMSADGGQEAHTTQAKPGKSETSGKSETPDFQSQDAAQGQAEQHPGTSTPETEADASARAS